MTKALKPSERKSPIPSIEPELFFKYPSLLRKLLIFITDNDDIVSLKQYCEESKLNYNSVKSTMARCRRKGNEFHDLIYQVYKLKLDHNRPRVLKRLQEMAEEGVIEAMRLLFKLTGDLQPENQKVEVNLNLPRFASEPDVMPRFKPGGDVFKAEIKRKEANGQAKENH